MGKRTISPKIIDQASLRLEGIIAISGTLDLGNGINVASFRASIEDTRAKGGSYHQQCSILEEKHAAFEDAKQNLADMTSRVLAAVAAKYGRDSVEYTQAGGVRKRDRKRPSEKSKPQTNLKGRGQGSVVSGQ